MDGSAASMMKKTDGSLVSAHHMHEHETLMDQVVTNLVKDAQLLNNHLANFKRRALNDVADLIFILAQTYHIETQEQDGRVTFTSFDGRYKVERNISTRMLCVAELSTAKIRLMNCIAQWPTVRRKNALGLVAYAFKTNPKGQVNTAAVLSLFKLEIDDPDWRQAMASLKQAIHANSTASYIHVYERVGMTDQYKMIPLDIAEVNV